mgnify:CR=1 FL=1|tara:strand:+ start:819 stop:977 length:159 start_codon:yes stop_codon:yes gene_type:complete
MDQLCEPIEVNRRFIKLIEQKIKPAYDKQLNELFIVIINDINKKYLKENINT